ncbi:MAG TPA: hypothetical protein VGI10_19865 [Polyangiaceae bacterium]
MNGRPLRWLWTTLLLLVSLPRSAAADSPIHLEVAPVLGTGSPASDGWGELSVRLENSGTTPVSGMLELRSNALVNETARVISSAPFSLAPHARVHLFLPENGLASRNGRSRVRALDTQGKELDSADLAPQRTFDALLFHLDVPSRIMSTLSGFPLPVTRRSYSYGYGGSTLSVTIPELNQSSGEAILPDLAAGYAGATLVLANGRRLSSMDPAALDALGNWLLAGGALAVSIDRPEDLASPWLEAFAGGRVQRTGAARALAHTTQFTVRSDPQNGKHLGYGELHVAQEARAPSLAVARALHGFSGGNLRDTPWGAAASYGLGELHLLAFDPNTEAAASDRWVELELADLVRHAWERASAVALPHAQASMEDARLPAVRKLLDPNQGTRWTIAVSALLLLLYAALAGPLNFHLAARKGRPLAALWHLPIWALSVMAAIVVLGICGKGINGRSRHLTLIEAGAGMGRAAATRFRGLYASSSENLTVRAARGAVLDVTGDPDESPRDLLTDRDGLRLDRLRAKPWDLLLVREDAFVNLAGGVSLTALPNGDLSIKNQTARDLLGVVVAVPSGHWGFLPRIKDGQSAKFSDAKALPSPMTIGATRALSAALFASTVNAQAAAGLGDAWEAFESLTGTDADWWPEESPVLLAQLEGGEGASSDSGLKIETDRVLIRVVGYGGVK